MSVAPVIVDICLVCRCENLTMGAGRYCLGRAPNSNVLYTIVHGWGAPVQVSGGVARLVQNNGVVKSLNTWLVKNLQYVLSNFDCSSVAFLAATVG